MVIRNSKGEILDPLIYTLQIIDKYPDVEIHIGTDSYSESVSLFTLYDSSKDSIKFISKSRS